MTLRTRKGVTMNALNALEDMDIWLYNVMERCPEILTDEVVEEFEQATGALAEVY